MCKPLSLSVLSLLLSCSAAFLHADEIGEGFATPPHSALPGVYWYFMDGNLNQEGMTADLESMKEAGLGHALFLEVNVGVPRGPVDFMSDQWQDLYVHAVREAERIGIDIILGTGPGWSGSGGPWVKPEDSMQHLVYSATEVDGPKRFDELLPVPEQRSTEWHYAKSPYYEDVVVYAIPRCPAVIDDIDEKALYIRNPVTAIAGHKPPLAMPALGSDLSNDTSCVPQNKVIDLTEKLSKDGKLTWDIPAGEWTILRMGNRTTGSSSRPAPRPGLGFECDKLNADTLRKHLENYTDKLLARLGPSKSPHGWKGLHLDSWEMGAQNWTPRFREEFIERRGYDPMPYLPVYSGRVIDSREISERFLWDLRMTCQEVMLNEHALPLKEYARKHGMVFSVEPYDMCPSNDLDLGAAADVTAGEFWSDGYGFNTAYSCIEASSVAHVMGIPVVPAEAFTANGDGWRQHPASMKNQGDWAFCMGINRFLYHTFAHQCLGDEHRPGMTMGPYAVHWDRGQTWWPMADAYHRYVARCSYLLQQGTAVSDILYLAHQGAPLVFDPPRSAMSGTDVLPDKKGFAFDGCSPEMLMQHAMVEDGKIAFPGGTSYRLLVLPASERMTPKLVEKIASLVEAGATVYGAPPSASPSLSDYPECDRAVRATAQALWGDTEGSEEGSRIKRGDGLVYYRKCKPGDAAAPLYPAYEATAKLLRALGVVEDFTSDAPVRYIHRRLDDGRDIYFLSNKSADSITASCCFRATSGTPQLWDPLTGEKRSLPSFTRDTATTTLPLRFDPHGSCFIVFGEELPIGNTASESNAPKSNAPSYVPALEIRGVWDVAFDPKWGGPEHAQFDTLQDWRKSDDPGVKYYSGIATYRKSIDWSTTASSDHRVYLELGDVKDMARVKINGQDCGVAWTAPWRIEITDAICEGANTLEIEVVNRWANRLLGDKLSPADQQRTLRWPEGYLEGREYQTGPFTFATAGGYNQLLPSGLLGPVKISVRKD